MIKLLIFFSIVGIQYVHGKEFSCPKNFNVSFKNEKHLNFEIYPKKTTYFLSSALLYSGHPKKMAALKGNPISRGQKARPFWLECKYKPFEASEQLLARPTLVKEIPLKYTRCKYTNDFKSVDCE